MTAPESIAARPRESNLYDVVVVEDEFLIRRRLRDLLRGLGHRVRGLFARPEEVDLGECLRERAVVLLDVYFGSEPRGIAFAATLESIGVPYFLLTGEAPEALVPQLGGLRPLGLILKPVSERELFTRLALIPAAGPPRARGVLWVRHAGLRTPVPLAHVTHVESDRNDCAVHTPRRRYVHGASLASLGGELAGEGFVRIHRSYLVNAAYVRGYSARVVRLSTGVDLPVGRAYRKAARDRLARRLAVAPPTSAQPHPGARILV